MANEHCLLYVSDAVSAGVAPIRSILRQSRVNNVRKELTGLLIFDGARFAQYIEGSAAGVEWLHELLITDDRHTAMEVLKRGPLAGQRLFPSWRMGYLKYDLDVFGLQGLRGKRADAALEAFRFIVPTLDIAIGDSLPT